MRLKKNHPWNPGYALPGNVLAETGDDIRVTETRPRGTYDDPVVSAPWQSGYALPGSVRAERPGQGVDITPWAPRGTGGRHTHGEFARTALEGVPLFGPTRGSKLARGQAVVGGRVKLGTAEDPIARFGTEGADALLQAANSAAKPGERIKVLRAMLNAIDPAMWTTVDAKMAKARARGVDPKQGLPKAVAAALANHYAQQVVQVGRSGGRAPLAGVLGITHHGEASDAHQSLGGYLSAEGFEGLGWSIGGAINSVGRGIKDATNATGRGIRDATNATGRGIRDATNATGRGIRDAAKATYNAAKKGLEKLGDLACKAADSGLLTVAAQGAGMAAGGPGAAQAGGQGAEVVKALCSKPGGAAALVPQAPAPAATGMSTTTMLLIGGAGLGALLLLRK
jgi:hypothetical protein